MAFVRCGLIIVLLLAFWVALRVESVAQVPQQATAGAPDSPGRR